MASPKCIKDIILETNKKAQFIKGFDEALVGNGKICGCIRYVAVYDMSKCIEILINQHDMSEAEALEHFTTTIKESPINDNKPLFINDFRKAIESKD
jgi:hypothetical protein